MTETRDPYAATLPWTGGPCSHEVVKTCCCLEWPAEHLVCRKCGEMLPLSANLVEVLPCP